MNIFRIPSMVSAMFLNQMKIIETQRFLLKKLQVNNSDDKDISDKLCALEKQSVRMAYQKGYYGFDRAKQLKGEDFWVSD